MASVDLYFQDPHEPLRLFRELEEENLFLIQNAHENATVCLLQEMHPISAATLPVGLKATCLLGFVKKDSFSVQPKKHLPSMQELEAMEKRFAETRVEMGARLAGLEAVISQLQRQLHQQREKCRQHTGMSDDFSFFSLYEQKAPLVESTGISLRRAKRYMARSMVQLGTVKLHVCVICAPAWEGGMRFRRACSKKERARCIWCSPKTNILCGRNTRSMWF